MTALRVLHVDDEPDILTSRARRRDLERFIAIGAVDVIAKPFDPMTLAAKLRGCMEEFCGFGKAKLDQTSCAQ
jgi:DNA-binding response OmpR family regulator